MPKPARLPSYEPLLAAYHSAFAPELKSMIGALPIEPGMRVLELACGDGAYTPWLAERVGEAGCVVAVDISRAYLQVARNVASRTPFASRITQVAAPVDRLPFEPGTFDFVWCAQSLFSLPDQDQAARAMLELARPGGYVAVLDDDTIHQVILPWPASLELSIRRAELDAFQDDEPEPGKFYVGRRLRSLLLEAGLVEVKTRSYASSRDAPLEADVRAFLNAYLDDLKGRVVDRLRDEERIEFLALIDPEAERSLVRDSSLTLTVVDHVVVGQRPKS